MEDGLGYTGTVNRLWFDVEARPVYDVVVAKTKTLLNGAGSASELCRKSCKSRIRMLGV
jgi:hypothetical protein